MAETEMADQKTDSAELQVAGSSTLDTVSSNKGELCMVRSSDNSLVLCTIEGDLDADKGYPVRKIKQLKASNVFFVDETETDVDIQHELQRATSADAQSERDREFVKFNEDLYHFFILYTLKYPNSARAKILISALTIVVFCIQFICVYALSYTYVYHWGREFVSSTHYIASGDDIQLSVTIGGVSYAVSGNVTSAHTIDVIPSAYDKHFDGNQFGDVYIWSAFAGLLVLSCYLLQTLNQFVSSMWALLTYSDYSRYNRAELKCHYFLTMLLIWLNMAIICSTWIFASYIIFYGVYFDILATSDIVLVPIGAVFILEIDDWAYSWFVSRYLQPTHLEDFWLVRVEYTKYTNSVWKVTLTFAVLFVSWVIAWCLLYNSVYIESGINYLFTAYLMTVGVALAVCLLIFFRWTRAVVLNLLNLALLGASPVVVLILNILWVVQTMDPDNDVDNWYYRLYGEEGTVDIDEAKSASTSIYAFCALSLVLLVLELVMYLVTCCRKPDQESPILRKLRVAVCVLSQLFSFIAALVFVVVNDGIHQPVYGAGAMLLPLVFSPTAAALNAVDWKYLCLTVAEK